MAKPSKKRTSSSADKQQPIVNSYELITFVKLPWRGKILSIRLYRVSGIGYEIKIEDENLVGPARQFQTLSPEELAFFKTSNPDIAALPQQTRDDLASIEGVRSPVPLA